MGLNITYLNKYLRDCNEAVFCSSPAINIFKVNIMKKLKSKKQDFNSCICREHNAKDIEYYSIFAHLDKVQRILSLFVLFGIKNIIFNVFYDRIFGCFRINITPPHTYSFYSQYNIVTIFSPANVINILCLQKKVKFMSSSNFIVALSSYHYLDYFQKNINHTLASTLCHGMIFFHGKNIIKIIENYGERFC